MGSYILRIFERSIGFCTFFARPKGLAQKVDSLSEAFRPSEESAESSITAKIRILLSSALVKSTKSRGFRGPCPYYRFFFSLHGLGTKGRIISVVFTSQIDVRPRVVAKSKNPI